MATDDEENYLREEANGEDAGEDGDDAGDVVERLRSHYKASTTAAPEHFTPRGGKGKKKVKKLAPIRINLAACKYEVLRVVQRKLGWREVGDEEEWEVYWTDTSVGIERIIKLTKVQKINHFNGMLEICRKKSMARNLAKMAKLFPGHYDFVPRTFLLPNDIQDLLADVKARGKKQIYIFKPDAGCQGRGIRLLSGGKEEAVLKLLKEMEQPNVVAQHYLTKPLLVHGYKFDMRIYALVLSCDPLRVFIFHEGLARFCTEKYTKPQPDNLHISFMHLTNYAVNKHNENFIANQGQTDAEDASKWTLQQLAEHLRAQGHDWDGVWERIQQLIVKSLASIQPMLKNNYRSVLPPDNDGFSCFEILGYDVMLDSLLQPWLIEVNHSPSFNIDSPLDLAIKEQLISDTLELVRVDPKLIAKAKKADKKAAAGRLLEPLQKKKLLGTGAGGAAAAAGVAGAAAGPQGGAAGAGAGLAGAGPAGAAAAAAVSAGGAQVQGVWGGAAEDQLAAKPKTLEEYEAIRAEALQRREKYELKHSGGFTRIYPTKDRTLQGLYDELIRGASELFQSTFQAKAKKTLDALGEERKRREETDTESVKAERAKARAHRDRLAQMAVERRTRRAADKTVQSGSTGSQTPPVNPLASYVTGTNGLVYLVPTAQQHGMAVGGYGGYGSYGTYGSLSRTSGVESLGLVGWPGAHQRSEVWGESDQGGCSPGGSLPGSRPASARSVEQRTGSGTSRLSSGVAVGMLQLSPGGNGRLARDVMGTAVAPAGSSGSNGTANIYYNQGGLPLAPFRGYVRGGGGPDGDVSAPGGACGGSETRGVAAYGAATGGAAGGSGRETSAGAGEGAPGAGKAHPAALRGSAAGCVGVPLSARDLAFWGSSSGSLTRSSAANPLSALPTPNINEKLQPSTVLETQPPHQQHQPAADPAAAAAIPAGVTAAAAGTASAAPAAACTPNGHTRAKPLTINETADLDKQGWVSVIGPALPTKHTTASDSSLLASSSSHTQPTTCQLLAAPAATSNQADPASSRHMAPGVSRRSGLLGSERSVSQITGWGVAGSALAPAITSACTTIPAPTPLSAAVAPLPIRRAMPRPLSGRSAEPTTTHLPQPPTSAAANTGFQPDPLSQLSPCPRAATAVTAVTAAPGGLASDVVLQESARSSAAPPLPVAGSSNRQGPAAAGYDHITMGRSTDLPIRSPTPTPSIYTHGPPPPMSVSPPNALQINGQGSNSSATSTTSNSKTYGGTIQYAADPGSSYWPVLGVSGGPAQPNCSTSSSFVIRPVSVSVKSLPKGGSLYASLRPSQGAVGVAAAPSGHRAGALAASQRHAGALGCAAQKILSVTGTKVVHAES